MRGLRYRPLLWLHETGVTEPVVEKLTVWKLITTEFNGRLVNGSYAVEDAMVKVKTWRGEKAIQGDSCNSIWVAGRLLHDLAAEGKG